MRSKLALIAIGMLMLSEVSTDQMSENTQNTAQPRRSSARQYFKSNQQKLMEEAPKRNIFKKTELVNPEQQVLIQSLKDLPTQQMARRQNEWERPQDYVQNQQNSPSSFQSSSYTSLQSSTYEQIISAINTLPTYITSDYFSSSYYLNQKAKSYLQSSYYPYSSWEPSYQSSWQGSNQGYNYDSYYYNSQYIDPYYFTNWDSSMINQYDPSWDNSNYYGSSWNSQYYDSYYDSSLNNINYNPSSSWSSSSWKKQKKENKSKKQVVNGNNKNKAHQSGNKEWLSEGIEEPTYYEQFIEDLKNLGIKIEDKFEEISSEIQNWLNPQKNFEEFETPQI